MVYVWCHCVSRATAEFLDVGWPGTEAEIKEELWTRIVDVCKRL